MSSSHRPIATRLTARTGINTSPYPDGTSATIDPAADAPEVVASRTLDDYARRRAASYPGRFVTRVMTWPARLCRTRRSHAWPAPSIVVRASPTSSTSGEGMAPALPDDVAPNVAGRVAEERHRESVARDTDDRRQLAM
ncbi:hypothetical protein GCM10009608_50570 [Pseudonocardia alaniniphila]